MAKMKKCYALIIILFSSVEIFQIDADTCNNGGTQLPGSHPRCSCPDGFKGFDCNQTVSPCEGRPCRNDGECIEHENRTFTCICTSKYDGILCEKRVRPCDSDPCKNGGNCSDDGVKCFKCECTDGYKGNDCSEKITTCEVFPCKNGGTCKDKKDGGFKCVCKKGFGGIFCDRTDNLYRSNVLEGKQEYIEKFDEYLGADKEWRLCYRASLDGWQGKDFHDRCDYKGPTVTLVSVVYNKNLHIFGGYTDISWGGSTGYRKSTKSFLFSLRNQKKQAFKSPIYRYNTHAIYNRGDYGPTFGGGHDLNIRNYANANTNSYTNLGHTYKAPFGYQFAKTEAKEILAGTYNFRPTEIEVYYHV